MLNDNKNTDSKSMGTCEKIFSVIGVSPARQSKRSMLHRRFKHDNSVPSVFDPPTPSAHGNNREMLEMGSKSGLGNINEKSSDYIQRAKLKIRAMTNVGMTRSATNVGHVKNAPGTATATGTGTVTEADHKSDKFSDFITRARVKMRATSNVGHGKNSQGVNHVNDISSDKISGAKVKKTGAGKFVSFK